MTFYAQHPELAELQLKIGLLSFAGCGSAGEDGKVGGNRAGYGYGLLDVGVPGLTPETAAAPTEALREALRAAVGDLEREGVLGITGDSSFMLPLQAIVASLTELPVFLSSLMQAAVLAPAHDPQQTFIIVSTRADAMSAGLSGFLRCCGLELDVARFSVLGCSPEGIRDPQGVAKEIAELRQADPKIAGAIFDSAELLLHADEVRAATKLPIFDHVTMLDFFISARSDNPYFGTSYSHEDSGGAEALVTKAQRRLFSPYESYMTSLQANVQRDAAIGVLRLEYSYPPLPGDVACAASYGYKVHFSQVDGLTFEKAQDAAMDEELQKNFEKAVRELESKGVVAITGDCGFMMAYQPYVRSITDLPVVISSILQAPFLAAVHDQESEFAILTSNSSTFNKDLLLAQSGVQVDTSRWHVVGLQDLDGFEAVAQGEAVPAQKVQKGLIERMKDMHTSHPKLRGILLECTELPHYADALRAATGLPVFDAITLVDYFQNSCTAAPSFARKVLEGFLGALNPLVIASGIAKITHCTLGAVLGLPFKASDSVPVVLAAGAGAVTGVAVAATVTPVVAIGAAAGAAIGAVAGPPGMAVGAVAGAGVAGGAAAVAGAGVGAAAAATVEQKKDKKKSSVCTLL